jgi:hypothetical protein
MFVITNDVNMRLTFSNPPKDAVDLPGSVPTIVVGHKLGLSLTYIDMTKYQPHLPVILSL